MEEHLEKVCVKTVVKCKFLEVGCEYECERREMEEHLNQGMKDHLKLSISKISRLEDKMFSLQDQHEKDIEKVRQEIAAVHQEDMKEVKQEIAAVKCERREMEVHLELSTLEISRLKDQCERREMEEHLNQEMKDHLELSTLEISRLKDQHQKDIKELRQEIAAFKVRQEIAAVKVRQEIAAVKVIQTSAVIITDFNKKLSEAKDSDTTRRINGDPFLTSPLGYKIQMGVDLNETREAYKDHTGVFIRLMRTDHDAMLSWPFKKKCTFSLIDQQDNEQERKNIVKTMTPAGQDEFKRPKDEQNVGIGFSKFVSHATLKTRKYIKDDTVFGTLVIEP